MYSYIWDSLYLVSFLFPYFPYFLFLSYPSFYLPFLTFLLLLISLFPQYFLPSLFHLFIFDLPSFPFPFLFLSILSLHFSSLYTHNFSSLSASPRSFPYLFLLFPPSLPSHQSLPLTHTTKMQSKTFLEGTLAFLTLG